jgi:hypothetical protein
MEDNDTKNGMPKWFQDHVPSELADSSLFKFSIKLQNGSVVEINLVDDIDINFDILEEQHEQIPAQYIYWAAIYSELRCATAIQELKMKSRRNSVVRKVVAEFKAQGTKLTDKQLNGLIEGDNDLVKNEAELAILQRNCGKVYHMVEAIKLRSEHCRSLAGFKRQEKEQSGRLT